MTLLLFFDIFVLSCSDEHPDQTKSDCKSARKGRGPDKKSRKSGKDHKNFKHSFGKTRNFDPKQYAAWKEDVLQRYNFCCFVTGENKKTLRSCHHLNSWDVHPEQRYFLQNGVVLQKSIHVAFHKEYGAGNTTTQQFEKFLAKKYKLFSYPWKVDNHEPILSVKEIEARRASQ
jgi:hypothetical protein